jgi:hypothetical protein
MGKPVGAEKRSSPRAGLSAGVRSSMRGRAKKVSLTVDEGVLSAMKLEARRAGRTLSAEVSDALAHELRRRRLSELIVEYETEHGAISAEELARIQAEWQA